METVRAHLAILSVRGSSTSSVAIENLVADAVTAAGHQVSAFESVKDAEVAIHAQLAGWIEDPDIDLVLVLGEGSATSRALAPLIDEPLPGFADLLRLLAFQELGSAAIRSVAEAARCGTTFVFVLPANANAVRAALDQLILPQLDPRTPQNLLGELPRLREEADITRVDHASGPVDRIPVSGASVPRGPRPPAKTSPIATIQRTKSRTGQNILVRGVEDPTKPIELVQLEEQLELSKTSGDSTQPMVRAARDTAPVAVAPPPARPDREARPRQPTPHAPLAAAGARPRPQTAKRVSPPAESRPTLPAIAVSPSPSPAVAPRPALATTPPRAAASPSPALPPRPRQPTPHVPAKPQAEIVDEDALEEVEAVTLEPDPPAATAPAVQPAPARTPTVPPAPARAPTVPPVPVPAEAPAVRVEPARPRPPTPAPIVPAGPVPPDLPTFGEPVLGDAAAPSLRRSRAPLVIALGVIVAAAAVLGYVLTRPPGPVREVREGVPPDATQVAAIAIDAGAPPEEPIEIEMPGEPPPITKPPRRDRRPTPPVPREPAPGPTTIVEPPREPPPAPAADGECDEARCVMDNYERPCCARFKPAPAAPPPTADEVLTKAKIRAGMERVRAAVIDCGSKTPVTGKVKVTVDVGAEGVVQSVVVQESPDPTLGNCVATAVRKARFEESTSGTTFTYPFVF